GRVRVVSVALRVLFGCGISVAAIQAELRNRLGYWLWNEIVHRPSLLDTCTDLVRGHVRRVELERDHAVAVTLEVRRRVARAGADGEPYPPQHLVRLLPGGEGGALVCADDEHRVAEVPAPDGVDRERVLVEHDLRRKPREGLLREPEARLGVGHDRSVRRPGRDQNHQAVDRQPLQRGAGERDMTVVRRIERAAEDPGHWNSSASPATSTSSP